MFNSLFVPFTIYDLSYSLLTTEAYVDGRPIPSFSRIFTNDSARKQFGYVDGIVNDNAAITGKIKIGLVYHGVKNLTEPQKKYFKLPVVQ